MTICIFRRLAKDANETCDRSSIFGRVTCAREIARLQEARAYRSDIVADNAVLARRDILAETRIRHSADVDSACLESGPDDRIWHFEKVHRLRVTAVLVEPNVCA